MKNASHLVMATVAMSLLLGAPAASAVAATTESCEPSYVPGAPNSDGIVCEEPLEAPTTPIVVPEDSTPTEALPVTGGGVDWGLVGTGVAMIGIGGGAFVLIQRRRKRA